MQEPKEAKARGWRNLKRLGVALVVLAGLVALFYGEEYIRGRLAWHRFRAQWEAKGEKFDLAAFIPPPIPDDQNFAMTPVVASAYSQVLDRNGHEIIPHNTNVVNRLQMPLELDGNGPRVGMGNWQKAQTTDFEPWQDYYRELAERTNLFPVASAAQSPAADVLLALSRYDATIEELRGAAALPASRFPVNYGSEEPYAILLPHLASLKGCTQVLRMRALAELETGQSDKALADVELALGLTEKVRSEPFLISHLVRIASLQLTEQAVWEGLAKHRWTDVQLAQMDRQLATFDFAADYQASLRSELGCQTASLEALRRHPEQLRELAKIDFFGGPSRGLPPVPARLIPSGWFYQNAVRTSGFILERFLPIGDPRQQTFSPALARQADQALKELRATPYTVLCKLFLPGLVNAPRRFAMAQATVNLSRTACALERHRLAQGKYPETLDALAPQFCAKLPHDPIGGQPLHYRLEKDGHFVLYSIGWNEQDDGGEVLFTHNGSVDLEEGDWTWRYPESEAGS